ncbi:MAG TPA: hypothetical protein VM621_03760 [Luteibacter sp.]|uniref:hypothetical protein n=1 Tax=Luteibacter sp. TaxID=1886636 RepID=UPI002C2B3861|nr:hypothetical protein [Luteibacter sp.]HVI54155.1 hypothetical protein [Luteibacter sp.]
MRASLNKGGTLDGDVSRDGRINMTTADAKNYAGDGTIASGDGTPGIEGTAAVGACAQLRLAIHGSKFTAVDIPAANAIVSPDIQIVQDAKGMNVTGERNIDLADVNVERLPGAGATKASPISADIRVDLGQKVHLVRATRVLNPNAAIADGQTVGLYVSGTAQRPIPTVFSNPVMEQPGDLFYLVTGKPLSQVRLTKSAPCGSRFSGENQPTSVRQRQPQRGAHSNASRPSGTFMMKYS